MTKPKPTVPPAMWKLKRRNQERATISGAATTAAMRSQATVRRFSWETEDADQE